MSSPSKYDYVRNYLLSAIEKEKPTYIKAINNVDVSAYIFNDVIDEDKLKQINVNFEKEYPKVKDFYLIDRLVEYEYSNFWRCESEWVWNNRKIIFNVYCSFSKEGKVSIAFGRAKVYYNKNQLPVLTLWKMLRTKSAKFFSSTLNYIFFTEALNRVNKLES